MLNQYAELKAAMLTANRAYAKVVNRYGNSHPKAIAAEQIANAASTAFWAQAKGGEL